MAKSKEPNQSRVVIFVEGDTDELLFKSLLRYYTDISSTPLRQCDICNLKGVTRYTSKLLAKLKNEYIPKARSSNYIIHTVCCSYDTDVFEVRNPLVVDWDFISKNVKRLGIDSLIRIDVKSSIEDWILGDIANICRYLQIKEVPKSLKGADGNAKLCDLFKRASRTYQKGVATKGLIDALDMSVIRRKHSNELKCLEEALCVTLTE